MHAAGVIVVDFIYSDDDYSVLELLWLILTSFCLPAIVVDVFLILTKLCLALQLFVDTILSEKALLGVGAIVIIVVDYDHALIVAAAVIVASDDASIGAGAIVADAVDALLVAASIVLSMLILTMIDSCRSNCGWRYRFW
jgi:hypothetical protein